MKLLDIKNNLVKISYTQEESITLASFIVLTDGDKSYIAQVVNLKAEPTANYAIARLILIFNSEGILDNFDGSIPSLQAETLPLDAAQLLSLLPIEKPIAIGELAQQRKLLSLDITLLEKRLLICAEKFNNINTIVNNFAKQLSKDNEKVVVIDTDYTFEEYEPIKLARDFKLPLNEKMIDFIYENDLEDVDATTRATIEEILTDVKDYAKMVDFIPFENFIKVVSDCYNQTQIPELALLKNKLVKYNEQNIFAQTKDDVAALNNAISENLITYIDIANVSEEMQKEIISYIQKVLENTNDYMYSFVKVNNKNANKKLLLELTNSEKVFTTIICSHGYKYVSELKQLAENIILFAPQTAQHDFAAYNTYLSKLNANEFIIYGDLTQDIPFIVELADIDEVLESHPEFNNFTSNQNDFDENESSQIEFNNINEGPNFEPIVLEKEPEEIDITEQVAKDVDETFFTNKVEEIPPIENILSDQDETLTEADLDFIEELPQGDEEIITEEPNIEEIPTNYTETISEENNAFEISEPSEPIFEEQTAIYEPDEIDINNEIPQSIEDFAAEEEAPQFDNSAFEINEDTQNEENIHTEAESQLTEEVPTEDLPVFPAEETITDNSVNFEQGDEVSHPKYGKGVVEKLIKYGNKTLCSISFEEVGRRLLDPNISELQKLS